MRGTHMTPFWTVASPTANHAGLYPPTDATHLPAAAVTSPPQCARGTHERARPVRPDGQLRAARPSRGGATPARRKISDANKLGLQTLKQWIQLGPRDVHVLDVRVHGVIVIVRHVEYLVAYNIGRVSANCPFCMLPLVLHCSGTPLIAQSLLVPRLREVCRRGRLSSAPGPSLEDKHMRLRYRKPPTCPKRNALSAPPKATTKRPRTVRRDAEDRQHREGVRLFHQEAGRRATQARAYGARVLRLRVPEAKNEERASLQPEAI